MMPHETIHKPKLPVATVHHPQVQMNRRMGPAERIVSQSSTQQRLAQLSAIANAPRNLLQSDGITNPVVQRTTFLIGYKANDPMPEAALNGIAAPNPIHAFLENGEPDTTLETKQKIESLAAKGEDKTALHIIGHGSPAALADIKDLGAFLETHTAKGMGADLKSIDLYACYAMMTTDKMEESVAYKVAKWAQAHLDEESKQTIRLKAGLTSNSSGLFAQGQPSYKWLDKEEILSALPIEMYLYQAVRAGIRTHSDEWKKETRTKILGELRHALSIGKSEVIEAILASHPGSSWGKDSRAPAETFTIARGGISNELSLKWGYFATSLDEKAIDDFPRRVAFLHGLNEDQVRTAFSQKVAAMISEVLTDNPFDAKESPAATVEPPVFTFGQSSAFQSNAPAFGFGSEPVTFGTGPITFGTGPITFGTSEPSGDSPAKKGTEENE